MLLSYNQLVKLIECGVINAPIENVNASSIDITLDNKIMAENESQYLHIDLVAKQTIGFSHININNYFPMKPGQFILASSRETFNLPNNISCEYKLKSSMARNGLEHLTAGWCDAGWNGSKLTLELKNMTKCHTLVLRPGMKIGQVVFFKHDEVPEHASYAKKGRYNGQAGVTAGKGIE
jgi:dCTP deaminase